MPTSLLLFFIYFWGEKLYRNWMIFPTFWHWYWAVLRLVFWILKHLFPTVSLVLESFHLQKLPWWSNWKSPSQCFGWFLPLKHICFCSYWSTRKLRYSCSNSQSTFIDSDWLIALKANNMGRSSAVPCPLYEPVTAQKRVSAHVVRNAERKRRASLEEWVYHFEEYFQTRLIFLENKIGTHYGVSADEEIVGGSLESP